MYMGMMDDMQGKKDDIMADPMTRAKIEQLAKDKGMSMEDAKAHYMKHGDQS